MDIIILLIIIFFIYIHYDCWYDKYILNKLYGVQFNFDNSEFKYYNNFNFAITPNSSRKFISIFKDLKVNKNNTVLDIGCGNGYFLLLVNKYLKCKKLYGVEIDKNTFKICKNNIKVSKCKNISIYHENAVNFKIPIDVNLIYLFNPFDKFNFFSDSKDLENYKKIIKNIKFSYIQQIRNIKIIFININDEIKEIFSKHFICLKDDYLFYQYQFINYSVYKL